MCEYDTATTVRQWLYTAPKFICLLASVLLVLLVYNINTRDALFDDEITVVLSNVFANFNQQPINQIALATDSVCPDGYDTVRLGKWSGTNRGCWCNDGKVFNSTCPKAYSSCNSIDPVKPTDISVWNSQTFCIQRTRHLHYMKNSTECSPEWSKCSYNTCLMPGDECPLTDLKIVPTDTATPPDYQEIIVGEETKLIYSRNSSDQGEFITDLKVTLYDKPCMDPMRIPMPEKGGPYSFSLVPEEGCGIYGAVDQLKVLDMLPVDTVLVQNDLTVPAIDSLPGFGEFISGENAYLMALQRYTVKHSVKCETINVSVFDRLQTDEANFLHAINTIVLTLALIGFTLLITLGLEFLMRYRNKEEERVMLRLIAYLNIGLLTVFFSLFIFKGVIAVGAQLKLNPDVYYLRGLRDDNCFQQKEVQNILESLLREINDDVYVILAINITLLFLGFCGLVVILILTGIDISQVRKMKKSQLIAQASTRDRRKKNKKNENSKNKGNLELLMQNQY